MLVPAVKLCEWIAIKRVLGKGEAWARGELFWQEMDFFFFFLWKQKEQEGYAEILRKKKKKMALSPSNWSSLALENDHK